MNNTKEPKEEKKEWERFIDLGVNSFISVDEKSGEYILGEDIQNLKTHLTESYRKILSLQAQEIREKVEGLKKETWNYAGGGGYDTETWCKKGVCFDLPGIKQIAYYGIRNESWWTEYLFRQEVIKPESLKFKGFNQAIDEVLKLINTNEHK